MKTLLWAGFLLTLLASSCGKTSQEQTVFIVNRQVTQERDSLIVFYFEDLELRTQLDFLDTTSMTKLNAVNIKLALDPSTDDAGKEEFVAGLKSAIQNLKTLLPVASIKSVSLDIGEQVFLTQTQVDSVGGDYEKMAEVNLRDAWTELSPVLKQVFPQAKFSALNWGW
jgi:hypothetical protein